MTSLLDRAVRALRIAVSRSADATADLSYAQRALRLLQRERTLDLATLIDRVADEAIHAARITGASALDVAVWGPSVFHMEAEAAIREMIGHTLVLECDGPWMLIVPTTRSIYSVSRPQRPLGVAPVPV